MRSIALVAVILSLLVVFDLETKRNWTPPVREGSGREAPLEIIHPPIQTVEQPAEPMPGTDPPGVIVQIGDLRVRFPVMPSVGSLLRVRGELYRVLEVGDTWRLEHVRSGQIQAPGTKPAPSRPQVSASDSRTVLNGRGNIQPLYGRWDYPPPSIQQHLTGPPHYVAGAMGMSRRDAELLHDSLHEGR